MHGAPPERHWVRESRSIVFWGGLLPCAAAILAWPTRGLSLAALPAAFCLIVWRADRFMRKRGFSRADSGLYALFCALAKVPQFLGLVQFALAPRSGRRRGAIDWRAG
jgi:hypothetical protein